ncbi:DUF2252 domain-containing protein [soil metagenome]
MSPQKDESDKPAKKDASAVLHDNTISPRDNRKERGKALRAAFPHKLHAPWNPSSTRRDPITVLEESNIGRIQELAPVRYGRMMQSPFTFYRGASSIMAEDLSITPNTGIRVQACGDCHLLNFGAFATPERNIIFDINDFDETLPAPWEWDLKRLAVSFVLAAHDNNLNPRFGEQAAQAVARSYRERMGEFAKMSILDVWYAAVDWKSVIERTTDVDLQKQHKKQLKKAMKRTIQDYYFPKMTQQINGAYKIKDAPPTIYHFPESEQDAWQERIMQAFAKYQKTLQEDRQRLFNRYRLSDFAIKVVGIGSVGTMCAVAVMLAPDDEPLLLQIKEARSSVLEPYAGKSEFENHGQRVVAGQRIVQSASDIFLGWTSFDDGRHFYIRQLRDTKVKPEPELWQGPQLLEIAETLGSVLARAHARSGDAAYIRGYLGSDTTFDEAIAEFSLAYAQQSVKDHAQLVEAVKSGRIKALIETTT